MIFAAYLKTCSALDIAFCLFGRLERTTVATAWDGQCQCIYFLQTFMLTMRYFYMEMYNKAIVDTLRLVQAVAACEQVIMKDAQPGGAP